MVPSPGTGWFTLMSGNVEIERLIKDLGSQITSRRKTRMCHSLRGVECALSAFDLLYLRCADSHTGAPEPSGFLLLSKPHVLRRVSNLSDH